eukprot:4949090-Alexandrium_andersonii.AAC.1
MRFAIMQLRFAASHCGFSKPPEAKTDAALQSKEEDIIKIKDAIIATVDGAYELVAAAGAMKADGPVDEIETLSARVREATAAIKTHSDCWKSASKRFDALLS